MKTLKESLLDKFDDQAKDLRRLRIEDWLEKYSSTRIKYVINSDYTIDVDEFIYRGKGNFPDYIQFKRCEHGFFIFNSEMTSLHGCPQWVGEEFDCSGNDLKTLEDGPEYVGTFFACNVNYLTDLKHAPKTVCGSFNCSNNNIRSLDGCPRHLEGYFDCSDNKLTDLKGGPQEVSGNYWADNNSLKTLLGGPKKVGDTFYCRGNNLSNNEILKFKKSCTFKNIES